MKGAGCTGDSRLWVCRRRKAASARCMPTTQPACHDGHESATDSANRGFPHADRKKNSGGRPVLPEKNYLFFFVSIEILIALVFSRRLHVIEMRDRCLPAGSRTMYYARRIRRSPRLLSRKETGGKQNPLTDVGLMITPTTTETKICHGPCSRELPLTAFRLRRKSEPDRQTECNDCRNSSACATSSPRKTPRRSLP